MRTFNIATAAKRYALRWKQHEPMSWEQVVEWLELDNPSPRKDCGGYVLGELKDGRRTKDTVLSRSAIALDADSASASFVLDSATDLGCALVFHTTWSHTPEKPHYRLLAPLSRDVTPDEYRLITEALMEGLGSDQFDTSATQPERLMHRPSTQGGDYQQVVIPGDPLDADKWLARTKEPAL